MTMAIEPIPPVGTTKEKHKVMKQDDQMTLCRRNTSDSIINADDDGMSSHNSWIDGSESDSCSFESEEFDLDLEDDEFFDDFEFYVDEESRDAA